MAESYLKLRFGYKNLAKILDRFSVLTNRAEILTAKRKFNSRCRNSLVQIMTFTIPQSSQNVSLKTVT